MYGLVLEGGGARGAYHIGVYKAIKEMGIEIGGVSGTSIGALNGAMILQDDYDKCYSLWKDISYSMVFKADEEEINKLKELSLSREDLSFLKEKIRKFILDRGLDITPLKKLLDQYIDEEKIRTSGKDFGIVTVNLSQRKSLEMFIEDIPKGDLKKYLLASAYLPFFKFERIDGHLFLDGAFYDNLPFKMLLTKGYTDLIIIRTHAPGLTRKIDLKGSEVNATIISPSDDIGKTYTYESQSSRRNIQLGYYDGLRAFKGLKGHKYYIEAEKNEDFSFNYFLNIGEKEVREIEEILKLPEAPYRRSLFEQIIPKLCSIMSIEETCTYEDLLIQLLEIKAMKLNIKRFKIYKLKEIISILEEENIEVEKEGKTVLEKIIKKVDTIYQFNKEETMLRISDIIFRKRN